MRLMGAHAAETRGSAFMHYWNTGNTRRKSPYQEEPSINNATPGKDCQAEREGGWRPGWRARATRQYVFHQDLSSIFMAASFLIVILRLTTLVTMTSYDNA
jgi:hypothetical protein